MTNEKAKKMLEAKLKCFIAETSGTNHDCNMRLCDGCALNYEQGNMGEQKQALDIAIQALERASCIKEKCAYCPHCEHCDVDDETLEIKALEQQPSEDCISRAEALKVLCDTCPMYDCITGCSSYRHIERMPSVTPQQTRWVPVSERLPEEMGTYMTTIDYGKHGLATGQRYYYGQGLWEDDCVIAWMPLPEPYKEREDKENE